MPRRRSPTVATARRLALAMPEATEGAHFGHPDFRVRNKIFASLSKRGDSVSLKTTPVNLDALLSADPDTFKDVWRGRWIGVRLDRVTLAVLRDLMEESWRLAAPRALIASRPTSAGGISRTLPRFP